MKKALLTSIVSDSHTWNLVYMQLVLEEYGYEVVNLGNCVPTKELISAAYYHHPDLIVVSSINGHGYIEGLEIIKAIKNQDLLQNIKTVIGGKLDIAGGEDVNCLAKLVEAGFDGVFLGENSIDDFISFLNGTSKLLLASGS